MKKVYTFLGLIVLFIIVLGTRVNAQIEVTAPTKTEYLYGEDLDLTGGSVRIVYADGTKGEAVELSEEMIISSFDSKIQGQQEITVKYGEDTEKFKVNVFKLRGNENVLNGKNYDGKGDYYNGLNEYRKAIYETALAFYQRGSNIQYCTRKKFEYAPEEATEDMIQYSTCIDFAVSLYRNALGITIPMDNSIYDIYTNEAECSDYIIANYKGEKIEKTANINVMLKNEPTDPSEQIKSIKYSCSDTNVAIVDENGKITAVGEGEAQLTVEATLNNNTKITKIVPISVELEVNRDVEITLSSSHKIETGSTSQIIVKNREGTEIDSIVYGTPYQGKKEISKNYLSIDENGLITTKNYKINNVKIPVTVIIKKTNEKGEIEKIKVTKDIPIEIIGKNETDEIDLNIDITTTSTVTSEEINSSIIKVTISDEDKELNDGSVKGKNYYDNVVKIDDKGNYIFTEFGNEILQQLRIGDIVTIQYDNAKPEKSSNPAGGHTMTVLDFEYDDDGEKIDAYLIHCYGSDMNDITNKKEILESAEQWKKYLPFAYGDGSIVITPMSKQFGTRYTRKGKLRVIRPLELIDENPENLENRKFKSIIDARRIYKGSLPVYDDNNGLGNNAFSTSYKLNTEDIKLTDSSKLRNIYPGINISKVSDKHTGSAVNIGDTITYTINIKNSDNYTTYNGIRVVENIPEEVEIKSVSNGGKESKDRKQIIWDLGEIAKNGETVLTYTVKVTGQYNRIIKSTGYVTKITNSTEEGRINNSTVINKICNTFTETEKVAIRNAVTDIKNSGETLTGIKLVDAIYRNAGLLPENEELYTNEEIKLDELMEIKSDTDSNGNVIIPGMFVTINKTKDGEGYKLSTANRVNRIVSINNDKIKPMMFQIEGNNRYMQYGIFAKTKSSDIYVNIDLDNNIKYYGGDIKDKETGDIVLDHSKVLDKYRTINDDNEIVHDPQFNTTFAFLSDPTSYDSSQYKVSPSIVKGNLQEGDIILISNIIEETTVKYKDKTLAENNDNTTTNDKIETKNLKKVKQYTYIYLGEQIIQLEEATFDYVYKNVEKNPEDEQYEYNYDPTDENDYITDKKIRKTVNSNEPKIVCEDTTLNNYYTSKEMYDVNNNINIFLADLYLNDYFAILSPAAAMPQGIKIETEENEIKLGETLDLNASIINPNATIANKITWESDDESIAKIETSENEHGEIIKYSVKGIKPGETTIRAKTGNGKEATLNVMVIEELELEIKGMDEDKSDGITYLSTTDQNITEAQLKSKIITNGDITIEAKGPKGEIGTGSIIKISKNGKTLNYTLIIMGDLTGDGILDDRDLLKMARYGVGLDKSLTGAYLKAGNVVKDEGYSDDVDLLKMARILVGLDNIE